MSVRSVEIVLDFWYYCKSGALSSVVFHGQHIRNWSLLRDLKRCLGG